MKFPRITISGARGIVGEDLTVENTQRMAWAYARFIGGGDVILGRDARPTGQMILSAVISGLLAGGARVIHIGLAPTPTVGIMIRKYKAKGGICITASHNPIQWNALKLFGSDGSFPDESFVSEYIPYLQNTELQHVKWNDLAGYLEDDSAMGTHIALVEQAIDHSPIRSKKFKVVIDGCRSIGGVYLPAMLERMGCEVVKLDCEPDGKFTRGLEPIPEHLDNLCEAVKQHQADIGFAADPDADRLAVVSQEGKAIGEEFTLALAAYAALRIHGGGNVVANLSTSMLLESAARMGGGQAIRTPIGEANVARGIREHNAVIGGEGNGGVMYPAVHNGRDSLTAAALVLTLMAETGKSVSALVSQFPDYVILKDKMDMDLNRAREKIKQLESINLEAEVDTRDGLKFIWSDSWLHLRCSNTEPIVRIIAEAVGVSRTQDLVAKGKQLMLG